MNFRFNYNNALANPTLVQELTLSGNVNTTTPPTVSFYDTHTLTGTISDIVSYNVSLTGGDGYPLNDIDYVSVGRISFDIIDSSVPIELTFRSKIGGNFPNTFIGEKYNNDLYIAAEASFNDYLQNVYCFNNTNPITVNDMGTGAPEITETYCVLDNDSDPETELNTGSISIVTGPTVAEGIAFVDTLGCISFTPTAGFSGTVPMTYEVCDDGNSIESVKGADNPDPVSLPDPMTPGIATMPALCSTGTLEVVVGSGGVKVSPKLYLEGPYNSGSGEMTIGVNSSGFLPTTEPFTAIGIHTGTETTTTAILANNAIVDWVLVELRDAANPTTVITTRAALLSSQGVVTDTDGVSPVDFIVTAGNYHVSVIHRNHLGIMTANALALSPMNTSVDFTTTALYGLNPVKIDSGVQIMWAGDSDTNGAVNAADRSNVWNDRNLSDYLPTDFTLDGTVNAADRSRCWNNRNLTAQLP